MPSGGKSTAAALDVAYEIARRQHEQRAVTAGQQPQAGSAPQTLSATLAGEASLTADATLAAAETPDTPAFTATITWPYEEMLRRLSELEATVAQLQTSLPSMPGIGHNNPPPLEIAEFEEIKRDIALLKAQPPPAPAEASKAANKFIDRGMRVLKWLWSKVDASITESVKVVTAGAAAALWLKFGQQLSDAAAAILQWLTTLLGG